MNAEAPVTGRPEVRPRTDSRARIALVHDWLTGMRGGEKALEVLCELYPRAELFTLVHIPGSVSPVIERRPIQTSFVQRLPLVAARYREYLPLFPIAVERFDFSGFDLVVSVSHCCVKSILTPPATRHLCYCLTPMRYAWDQFDAYFGPARVGRPASWAMRRVMGWLARWDRATAYRPDRYVAISHYVAGRIRRYYNRESTVVYPPVETDFFQPVAASQPAQPAIQAGAGGALVVSALVPYKRLEIAIDGCRRAGVPLTIIGDGPERPALERHAGPGVRFEGRVPDEEIRRAYQQAAIVLLPGEEDFGIVPVEAQACGTPVVALARGGATETVIDGQTGVLVDDLTADGFADGIRRALAARLDRGAIRAHAERFSRTRFAEEMQTLIDAELARLAEAPVDASGAKAGRAEASARASEA